MTLSRRELIAHSSVVLGGAMVASRLAAQSPPAPPATAPAAAPSVAPPAAPAAAPAAEPKFTDLRGGVGIFQLSGGTIGWWVGGGSDQRAVVVDTQVPDNAPRFLEGFRTRASLPIALVINTHHHWDHTGGNAALRPHATSIVAHRNTPALQRQAATERQLGEPTIPDTLFADFWRRDFGSEQVAARHYEPGHTGGDIVVHFEKANVVHLGDLVFNRLFPVIDRPGGARIRRWAVVLERAAADYGDSPIYLFGHANPAFGVTGAKADLLYQRDYLTALIEHAQRGLAAGHSVDEIAKAETLAGFPDHMGRGAMLSLATNLRAACAELTDAAAGG